MKRSRHIAPLPDDDENGYTLPPSPPPKPTSAQPLAPGYLWNSTTQELIPILPEDHSDYRQNEEIIAAAIRRWNRRTS